MNKSLNIIRLVFILLCGLGGWLVSFSNPDLGNSAIVRSVGIGVALGGFMVLVDLYLKGFSLRGLSALTFGLAVGSLVSWLIGTSPLFSRGDPDVLFNARLGLFVFCTYLGAVIALRGRDEFNVVIPFIRFVPHDVESPLVVVDASALIDGRVARICEAGFITSGLVVPRFVLAELQRIADSPDPVRQARGRRGLDVLNQLKQIKGLETRTHDSEVSRPEEIDAKLIFVAQSLKARLLTTDMNLAKMAQFHGVGWLNLGALGKALAKEWLVGETLSVDLVKPGKDEGQAVGYLEDGSMVVVTNGRALLGRRVSAEITGILPSQAGRILFARCQPGTSAEATPERG